MRRIYGWLGCLLLSSALMGCPVPPPRYPIREGSTITSLLHGREEHTPSLRAEGTVEHYGRDGRVRGSVQIYVHRPNKLRVDTYAFNTLISSMRSDGVRHGLLQDKKYYIGEARPCVALQLLGIALEGSDIVTVLTGGVPLLSPSLPQPVWRDGNYVVTSSNDRGEREEIRFELPSSEREKQPEQQRIRPARVILSDAQGVRLDVTYESYREIDGTFYPDRVRIQQPRERTDTIIRFDVIVPNFTIPADPDLPELPPPDPYSTDVPAGAETVLLTCESEPPPPPAPQQPAH